MPEDLFSHRKPLAQILDVPATVTSVYSMVQHIWAGDTDEARRENRKQDKPRLATVEEYFLDPVRSYLERFLQDVADGEGQGYWLLAHFGVGKSHLMAVESILAIGGDEVWDIVKRKEDEIKGSARLPGSTGFAIRSPRKRFFRSSSHWKARAGLAAIIAWWTSFLLKRKRCTRNGPVSRWRSRRRIIWRNGI
jgi:hypothetical protein